MLEGEKERESNEEVWKRERRYVTRPQMNSPLIYTIMKMKTPREAYICMTFHGQQRTNSCHKYSFIINIFRRLKGLMHGACLTLLEN
ncbi:unnamed protein product, partial [Vitis vinifera]|uniref:Uncharacterized protein n=1 Tax=Vitis vinifera TaxID=29760 RepID=D7TYF7_VITVI